MINRFKKIILILALIFFCLETSQETEQKYYMDPNPEIQKQLDKWQDLKFRLLMHLGTYSQWGIVESWSICSEDLSWAVGGRKKGQGDNDFFAYKKNMRI